MRRARRHGLWLGGLLAPAILAGSVALAGNEEAKDGLDVYFREADLSAISDQQLPVYNEAEAGESKLLERAFPGAPPQIPHTVEDMLPITANDNECLECRDPENAVSKRDAPLPESHFERPVMADHGRTVKGYEKAKQVFGARYNCSMCHTPQATNVKTPSTTFVRMQLERSK